LHAAAAMVDPLFGESLQNLPAQFGAEIEQRALTGPRRAQHGEEVAMPLVRNPDTSAAHPHDVLIGFVVGLHLDRRKDQRAFLVDVARRGK